MTGTPDPGQESLDDPVTAAPAPIQRQTWRIIALGFLIVISLVGVSVLAWLAIDDAHDRSDRAAALAAARTNVTEVLNLDPAKVNEQLATAQKLVSGSFAAQFAQLATVIRPAAARIGLTITAEVRNAAIVDSQPDQADILMFVKQSASATSQPAIPRMTPLEVTMTKSESGKWLISGLRELQTQ